MLFISKHRNSLTLHCSVRRPGLIGFCLYFSDIFMLVVVVWRWSLQAHILACLVRSWWTVWKGLEDCGLDGGGVWVGDQLWHFTSPCQAQCLSPSLVVACGSGCKNLSHFSSMPCLSASHRNDNGLTLSNCKPAPSWMLSFPRLALVVVSLKDSADPWSGSHKLVSFLLEKVTEINTGKGGE